MIVLCLIACIRAGRILNPLLFIEDGRISSVSSRTEREIRPKQPCLTLPAISQMPFWPRLRRYHMHGGAGVDVMRAVARRTAAPQQISDDARRHRLLSTTVAAPLDQTCTALERIADAIESAQVPAPVMATRLKLFRSASIWKVHFSATSACGVHPPENLIEPTLEIFERLWQAARGHVRMITIAPNSPER